MSGHSRDDIPAPAGIAGGELISLRKVGCSYPLPGGGAGKALDNLSLTVHPGEKLVVLGAAGSGKTTLSCILAGILDPSEGTVLASPVLEERGGMRLARGLVTQNPEDTFTSPLVREEMGMVLQNLSWADSAIDDAVAAALEETGLAEHADLPPALLSGGQKQLLAVASVFIADPVLILLDEPLSLLDSGGRREVSALLARRAAGGGRTTVFFSSEVEDALRGDRVVILDRGKLTWSGLRENLPLDEETLSRWGLLPPDLSRLVHLIFPPGAPERSRLWRPGDLAELLCRSG